MEFHEPSGIEEWYRPEPTTYRCSHCGTEFQSTAALREHRFQAHPLKRPLLLIEGIEVGSTPITLTRAIDPSQVGTGACSTAVVNGVRVPIKQLPERLASIEHDIVKVLLEGEGATASFEIRIEIASDRDIKGVEQAFFDVARHRRLDVRAIEHFISGAEGFKTAASYCDGICEYLYAVLAKERAPASSLPYAAYREKFNRALERLAPFERPLANRIGGLIEFHFNHFQETTSLSPGSRVAFAATAFSKWLSAIRPTNWEANFFDPDNQIDSLLTDWDTERLIRWAVRVPSTLLREQAQMESMLRGKPAEFDQTKLHILLGEMGLASRNRNLVLSHARKLRNSPGFAVWADEAIASTKSWSEH